MTERLAFWDLWWCEFREIGYKLTFVFSLSSVVNIPWGARRNDSLLVTSAIQRFVRGESCCRELLGKFLR